MTVFFFFIVCFMGLSHLCLFNQIIVPFNFIYWLLFVSSDECVPFVSLDGCYFLVYLIHVSFLFKLMIVSFFCFSDDCVIFDFSGDCVFFVFLMIGSFLYQLIFAPLLFHLKKASLSHFKSMLLNIVFFYRSFMFQQWSQKHNSETKHFLPMFHFWLSFFCFIWWLWGFILILCFVSLDDWVFSVLFDDCGFLFHLVIVSLLFHHIIMYFLFHWMIVSFMLHRMAGPSILPLKHKTSCPETIVRK